MEKQGKTKDKAKKPVPGKAKTVKGKTPVNEERFRGNGISFKGKLVGISEVNGPRGDNMCIVAIKKLKLHAIKMNKEIGEHKQKIILNINLKGIHIIDEKTQLVVHEHMINKVSYITHDPEDKRTFGYIVSAPSSASGHQLFALKTEKPASTVTATLYELFQVVYKLRQEAQKQKAATPTTPAKKPASSIGNGAAPDVVADGIYEEPANCTPPQSKKPPTPHYKIPKTKGVPDPPPPRQNNDTPGEAKKDEDTGSISSADRQNYESPTFDAEPIFGASFVPETERKNSTLSETGSVTSANVFRSDSMSSSSSDATAKPGEHVRAAVLSPVGDVFTSSSEGTPASAVKRNFSFDAAFPTVSSTSEKPVTTNDSPNENQPLHVAFPNDSSFGSKGNEKENQSVHATFPDDSDFGSQHFAESGPFKAVFPDDSSFGSKAETTADNFASFEDAFSVDSSFSKTTETAPVTCSENQRFESSFAAVTSSSSEKQSASTEIESNGTDVDSSLFASALNTNNTEQTFETAFPPVAGPCTDVNKLNKPAFEDAFSDPSVNIADNDTNQGFNDDFKPAFNSNIGDLGSTNETVNKADTTQQVPTSLSINKIGGQVNQTGEGAVTTSTGTSVGGDVESKNEDADSTVVERVGFQADFSSFQSTAEVTSSTDDKFEPNFEEAFSPVTMQETVKHSVEPTAMTSDKENNLVPSSSFDNSQEPAVKSPEKFEALFSSNDPFSASVEDIKTSPLDSTDPFVAGQEAKTQQGDCNQFEVAFGADSFLSSPFEFKDATQNGTEQRVSELSNNVNKAASSDKSSENFGWQDAFGGSSVTTSKSVSAVDDGIPAAEPTLTTISNIDKPTMQEQDISSTDSSPAVIEKNEDNKNESLSPNQDPFSEFQVDFDAFKATKDTTESEGRTVESEEVNLEVLKAGPSIHTSVKLVDEEPFNNNVEKPKVETNITEKPTQLNFSSNKIEDQQLRAMSPSAPPPLPPRPAVTLPSLPPRPKPNPNLGISVPAPTVETPPVPPLPKTSQTRKPPPALPPRTDLQSMSGQKVDSFTLFDPFGVESAGTASDNSTTWASDWPPAGGVGGFSNETKAENNKSDQFGDDFFTNFDFDKSASDSTSRPATDISASSDPFASTAATDPFGSDDLFSQSPFASSKATRSSSVKNVFGSSISESFSAVSNSDPFSDINDPFAGKEHVISDPFSDSPEKKDIKLEEDPFSDSFA